MVRIGFDLVAIDPKDRFGESFRNAAWWWGPLWDFCCLVTPELTYVDRYKGSLNEGYVVDGKKHSALILRLRGAVLDKKKYEGWYLQGQKFSWENVAEFLSFIENNEGFEIICNEKGCHVGITDPFIHLLRQHGIKFGYLKEVGVVGGKIEPPKTKKPKGKSKLKKWSCGCTNVRVAVKEFEAKCLKCGEQFELTD